MTIDSNIADKLSRKAVQECELYIAPTRKNTPEEIYLDANENPYATIVKLDIPMNRYPESQPQQAIARYADFLGIDQDEILATLGGDSAIELLIKAFCEPNQDKLLYCPPTFGMYQVTCDLYDVKTVQIPLLEDFVLDTDAIINNLDGVKMVFLCSPNNPTGNTIAVSEVERILEATRGKAIVVLDEAYIEFSEIESFAKRVKEFPHLALVRTLSKAFGLAGIRFGFVVGSKDLINVVRKVISPYPLPVPAIAIAETALLPENIDIMRENRKKILKGRDALVEALGKLDFVTKIYKSESNFVLVEMKDSKAVFDFLCDKNIFVRYQSSPLLKNTLRIAVGLPNEQEALIQALAQFEAENASKDSSL